jgi:hypothetical protein
MRLPAAQDACGGHVKVRCNAARCDETAICKQGVRQPLYSTEVQQRARTYASKHCHQRLIQQRRRTSAQHCL